MRLMVGFLLWPEIGLSPHASADTPASSKKGPVVLHAEAASGAKLHFTGEESLPSGIILHFFPQMEDGPGNPPLGFSYWHSRNSDEVTKLLPRFPIVAGMEKGQQMSVSFFVDVTPGPYVALAFLPGHAESVASEFLNVKIGSAYKVIVPPFVPVWMSVKENSTISKVIQSGDWMILAQLDGDPSLEVTSVTSPLAAGVEFWALIGRRHELWLIPNASAGVPIKPKGYPLKPWIVPEDTKPRASVKLEAKEAAPALVEIPRKSDAP